MNNLHEKQFTDAVSHPSGWRLSALTLLEAANILAEKIIPAEDRDLQRALERSECSGPLVGQEAEDHVTLLTHSVWVMLCGLAVENLLKALIAASEGPDMHKRDRKQLDVGSHKLVALRHRAKIGLTQEEDILLRDLTHYVEWRGKYSRPKSAAAYVAFEEEGIDARKFSTRDTRRMKALIDQLMSKLDRELAVRRESIEKTNP